MSETTLDASTWVTDLAPYACLHVGYSGGLDSTVLLHGLLQQPTLKTKLHAIHINHGLSPNASQWQAHCQQVCQSWDVAFTAIAVSFAKQANIEQAARMARYDALGQFVQSNHCLLLGHHLDDQAETVLLQLFRGAGIDGLAAMVPITVINQGDLRRPLLSFSRQSLLHYAEQQQLSWIDDESNTNLHFSRNFLRHQVMPLLQQKWPGVVNNLARTAKHCQQARANLYDLAKSDCGALITTVLPLQTLIALPPARVNNILRNWLSYHQVKLPNTATFQRLLSEVIMAQADANPSLSWDGIHIRRYQQQLYLLKEHPEQSRPVLWESFPQSLLLPQGELFAKPVQQGLEVNPASKVEVRFRQGGEKLHYKGHTHSLKKLMQQWRIPPWLREQIPLLYINNQLAAVVSFGYDDRFFSSNGGAVFDICLKKN